METVIIYIMENINGKWQVGQENGADYDKIWHRSRDTIQILRELPEKKKDTGLESTGQIKEDSP